MEYLFIYDTCSDYLNYLSEKSTYLCDGFLYGTLYQIDKQLVLMNSNIHNHVNGKIMLLSDDFNYLDDYFGSSYERKEIPIHTESSIILSWVYILKKI